MMRHVKGQKKDDSMKETGRMAAEAITDTNTGDLPEGQSRGRVRHCRQVCEVRTRQDPLDLTVVRSLVSAGHRHMRRDTKVSCSRLQCEWKVW